jgi:hypothetical protein
MRFKKSTELKVAKCDFKDYNVVPLAFISPDGLFAYHKAIQPALRSNAWTVTHVQTGASIYHFKLCKHARAMAVLLVQNANSAPEKWDSLPAECKTAEAIKAHFAINKTMVIKLACTAEAL